MGLSANFTVFCAAPDADAIEAALRRQHPDLELTRGTLGPCANAESGLATLCASDERFYGSYFAGAHEALDGVPFAAEYEWWGDEDGHALFWTDGVRPVGERWGKQYGVSANWPVEASDAEVERIVAEARRDQRAYLAAVAAAQARNGGAR